MGIAYATHRREEKVIKTFCRKTWREELVGRPRHIWRNNINLELKERGHEGVEWMRLAQDRDHWWVLVNTVMNLSVRWKAVNFLTSSVSVNLSLLHGVHCFVLCTDTFRLPEHGNLPKSRLGIPFKATDSLIDSLVRGHVFLGSFGDVWLSVCVT